MGNGLEQLWTDIRYATRMIARTPGTSLVAVLALGLGMGLTTTMFSIVYGILFRGLPYEDSDRIVAVGQANLTRGMSDPPISIHEYTAYAAQQRSFEQLAAFSATTVSVSGTEHAERAQAAQVTANIFDLVRVRPLMGRTFTNAEQNGTAAPVAIIGYHLWQQRFAGDAQILGKSIRVNGQPRTIVGVMPERFRFPYNYDLWLPLERSALSTPQDAPANLQMIARLREGVGKAAAVAELTAIAASLDTGQSIRQERRPFIRPFIDYFLGEGPKPLLLTMLAAVFFVLLIGCTNVANLLLSRAVVRGKEIGIRNALGAARARIITQFLAEAVVLCVVGAALGTLLASIGIDWFNASIQQDRMPFWAVIEVDRTVLAFVFALTILTALMAGVLPALQAARSNVSSILKDDSRALSSFRVGRTSRMLVIAEIALSCGLLVAAGLTSKSIIKLRNVDLGFDANNLFTGVVLLPEERYAPAQLPRAYAQLQSTVSQVNGFSATTIASSIPGLGGSMATPFALEGRAYADPRARPLAEIVNITPDYLATLGKTVAQGRNFSEEDRVGSLPVVLVSAGFARRHLDGGNPIGRRVQIGEQSNSEWRTIVGVLPDIRLEELAQPGNVEFILTPVAQQAEQRFFWIIGRTRGEPLSVTRDVRDALARVDRDLVLYQDNTLRGAIANDTWFFSVFGGLFIIFGITALSLAAIGLYAVMAFSVSQRTREVGIRMALGATAAQVRTMILGQGMKQVSVGMVLGLAFAALVARVLTIILFDVNARDPLIFLGVVTTLVATAVLACLIPARRATAVDPLVALRHGG